MGPDAAPTPAELKKLRLRYAGPCMICGAPLPQGAQALYHAASKTVRCIISDAARVTIRRALAEPPPLDSGTAGGSAQREHDRRAAKREERVKERFGRRFGGVILAVVDEPQSTSAWAKGARGEQKLAEAIAGYRTFSPCTTAASRTRAGTSTTSLSPRPASS